MFEDRIKFGESTQISRIVDDMGEISLEDLSSKVHKPQEQIEPMLVELSELHRLNYDVNRKVAATIANDQIKIDTFPPFERFVKE